MLNSRQSGQYIVLRGSLPLFTILVACFHVMTLVRAAMEGRGKAEERLWRSQERLWESQEREVGLRPQVRSSSNLPYRKAAGRVTSRYCNAYFDLLSPNTSGPN